jgi:hypothetical protein
MKDKLVWKFQNSLSHMLFNLWIWVLSIRDINSAMVLKVGCAAHVYEGIMHMFMRYGAHEHVSMTRLPMEWRRSICVASPILTTKIPSALLVVHMAAAHMMP